MSREYKGKRIVVWPSYIDELASRGEGRRISRSLCVKRPTVEEIRQAALALGLEPVVEEKPYPRSWWLVRARVVVNKAGTKRATLEMIARKISEMRRS